jgi:hypothetical protein
MPPHPSTINLLDSSMSYAKQFHSTARPSVPPEPTACRPAGSRHERIAVVGALYDVGTGKMGFMLDDAIGPASEATRVRGTI